MRKPLFLLLMVVMCSMSAMADRYVIDSKQQHVILREEMQLNGEEWHTVNQGEFGVLDNGYEFESVAEPSDKYFVMAKDSKHYKVWTKDIKRVTSGGDIVRANHTTFFGSTFLVDWYMSPTPGLIGLCCGFLALIVFFIGLFRENSLALCGWIFGGAMALIAMLEIIGFFCVGSDVYWWVNPDEVGYIVAIIMLVPFSMTAVMQILALKIYKIFPVKAAGPNIVLRILMGIGCVIAVVASIQVIINFIFAAFCLGFLLYLGGQRTYSRSGGDQYETSIFGTRKVN